MTAIERDVVIVGAGLAGLTAARHLAATGKSVLLVDKGRGPGGRLATRRIGGGRADHGAQFFTVRSPELAAFVEEWLTTGLIFEWSRGWSNGSLAGGRADGFPRYAVREGLNNLAKHLATGLDVMTATKVISVSLHRSLGWALATEDGQELTARNVLLTAPVPQSLALLAAGGVELATADKTVLEGISYEPCLCGIFVLDRAPLLPDPGAVQRPEAPISWIADNQRKGISPDAVVLTVHAGPEASRAWWEAEEDATLAWMLGEIRQFLALETEVLEAQLKCWRYALPESLHPDRYLLAQTPLPLLFAGDAFGEPRVEGAILSGLAAGRALARLV